MYVLQIEYPIADYNAWKTAFDDDRLDRAGSGVRRYRILQPTNDPNYVMIDLEFDELGEAEAYFAALQRAVYSSQEASNPSPLFTGVTLLWSSGVVSGADLGPLFRTRR